MNREAGNANVRGVNREVQQQINIAQQPITSFSIKNSDVFDHLSEIKASEENEFMLSLKRGDPVLIINPCQLSGPGVKKGEFEDIDNPYN